MTTKTQEEIDKLDVDGLNTRLVVLSNTMIQEGTEQEKLFPEYLYIKYRIQRLIKERNN